MKLDATQRRALLSHPAGWIATGFGSGLSPRAPGTVGSAAALLPWLLIREWPPLLVVFAIAIAFGIGVAASRVVIERLGIADPGCIVWDEFVGQWLAWTPLLFIAAPWWWLLVGFALFRLFDIGKPWPVSWADRHVKGGLGVMLDDALAGLGAALGLCLLLRFA